MKSRSVGSSTASWVANDGWHRAENLHFYAYGRERGVEREPAEMSRHVLEGWRPPSPFIRKDQLITAFGSCFASHVESYLRELGFLTSVAKYGDLQDNYWSESLFIKCGEGFVNTFSIRYQFEMLLEGKHQSIPIWYKSGGKVEKYIADNKGPGESLLRETDIFIITLGLSEVVYSKQTGMVMWSGVPESDWDPSLYGYRVTTVEENRANLEEILALIRKHRGDVPVILTLSPVPLNATFRDISCITANSVSKAILRVAIDELMRMKVADANLHYFPSYEIVTGYLQDPWDVGDLLHPAPDVRVAIMAAFREYYCAE